MNDREALEAAVKDARQDLLFKLARRSTTRDDAWLESLERLIDAKVNLRLADNSGEEHGRR
jgi:hypothetical protein